MSDSHAAGTAPGGQATRRSWVIKSFTVLTILCIGAVVVAFLLPDMGRSRPAPRRAQCKANLHQIAMALHQYEEEYHALPPAYTVDAYGNPLHSWRTLILPYLDQMPLYQSIDLSKPWNDPVNAKAFNTLVATYRCPVDTGKPHHTIYMASMGPDGCLRPAEPRRLAEITDDPSQTLLAIEVPLDQSVPWMSPEGAEGWLFLNISPESKLAHVGGIYTALCDGSIRFISADLPAATRRALISIAGGETIKDILTAR
jgi:Protein of unknown function (DUF1559)